MGTAKQGRPERLCRGQCLVQIMVLVVTDARRVWKGRMGKNEWQALFYDKVTFVFADDSEMRL